VQRIGRFGDPSVEREQPCQRSVPGKSPLAHPLLMSADGKTRGGDVHVLACTECPRVSGATARGWKAFRAPNPESENVPMLVFYCPECAKREFETAD
jgi:hypothetical protein